MQRKRKVVKRQTIKVEKSSYSPTKAERKKFVKIPKKLEGASFDAVVSAAIRPADVVHKNRPK